MTTGPRRLSVTALAALVGAVGCTRMTAGMPAAPPVPSVQPHDSANRAVVMRSETLSAVAGGSGRRQFVRWEGTSRTAAYALEETGAAGEAEVHLAADDYHHILAGRVRFALGGTLVAPREVRPGEWRAPAAAGADTVELKAGDVLFVPRGTMHQRLTGAPYSVLVTKVYSEVATARPPRR